MTAGKAPLAALLADAGGLFKAKDIVQPGALCVSGLVDCARSLLAAAAFNASQRDLFVVASSQKEQERVFSELTAFLGPERVLFYPAIRYYNGMESSELVLWGQKTDVLRRMARARRKPLAVVSEFEGLLMGAPEKKGLSAKSMSFEVGAALEPDAAVAFLESIGYCAAETVSRPGQYSRRGCVLDVFAANCGEPLRLSFFGDEIESVRFFDLQSQKTVRTSRSADVVALCGDREGLGVFDYIPGRCLVVMDEPVEIARRRAELENFYPDRKVFGAAERQIAARARLSLSILPEDKDGRRFESISPQHFLGSQNAYERLRELLDGGFNLLVACNNEGERDRLKEILAQKKLGRVRLVIAGIDSGFIFPREKLALLTDQDIFGRYKVRPKSGRMHTWTGLERVEADDIRPGQHVVHIVHGIGKFRGVERDRKSGRDRLVIEYRDKARLYVPVSHIYLLEPYMGVGGAKPRELDKLGTGAWARKKARVQAALMDTAAEMLELQARRESSRGFAFPPDNEWQVEFEKAFLYEDTADQAAATAQIKADMQNARPMDRLVCGDVGFGKTEVAIRAAFKAVMAGKQVAVLVPTTILAFQHLTTFRERMADYPVNIEMLSRFRSRGEQKKTVAGLASGEVDIIIGTHRLIQKDIVFGRLGLLIIDEEQRFGVRHKEQFKKLRSTVDILTITATPIPRTLYMALTGIREMSSINTPPKERLPVKTVVVNDAAETIERAIDFEIRRGGQVFFLHNRVHDIKRTAERLADIAPNARIAVAHGQMAEGELETVVSGFVEGKADILVCTTIIESGVDIPNANTIIIDNAYRFGLSELYQLRGRVGRYRRQAYAYLIVPDGEFVPHEARSRLQAITTYDTLGSGYAIALKDLEIRGAGNILGEEQSGHIAEIGFDLYCKLLKENILKLKGRKSAASAGGRRVLFDPGFEPELPASYIPSRRDRMDFYKRIGNSAGVEELEEISAEMFDRFGAIAEQAGVFLNIAKVRMLAGEAGIFKVEYSSGRFIGRRAGGESVVLCRSASPGRQQACPRDIVALINCLK